MKIAIYGKGYAPTFNEYFQELLIILENEKVELYIFEPFYKFVVETSGCKPFECQCFSSPLEAPDDVDFLISIGGDGTFLESMLYLKSSTIPVIGINSGRMGFLANISKEEISKAFDALFNKQYQIEERSLLRVESDIELFDGFNFALNEVTIQKTDSSLISIDAWLNGEYLNTYWTDGLIVATPTGSTAYSLSVGGPIVVPRSNNFIITPIASHNLTVRPVVVSDSVNIELKIKTRNDSFLITVDNRVQQQNMSQGVIHIRKSKFVLKMLKLPFNNYYSTLRSKLMWGVDNRN